MRTIKYINQKVLSLHFVLAKEDDKLVFVGSECAGIEEMKAWFQQDNVIFVEGETSDFESIINKLERFYLGEDVYFDEPMALEGTELQLKVWEYLKHIPYGTTQSYKDVAYALGCPLSVRAVASAVGKNPLLIVIPCHRVIGSNGQMRGYRGGMAMKHRLLSLEKSNACLAVKMV